MRYPSLVINRKKLTENTKIFYDNCKEHGINMAAVTKCYNAIPEVAQAQIDAGVTMLADSRVENLKKMAHLDAEKFLIRIPMISQADEVVQYADISVNSEIEVIKALSQAALKVGKVHKILMMIDIGDLREGVWKDDAMDLADQIMELKGVQLVGVGANFSCFGGVIPDRENLGIIVKTAEAIEAKYGIKIEYRSGGNSVTYDPMMQGIVPEGINHMRFGELSLVGYDGFAGKEVPGGHRDAFILKAEIVELKEKPSLPIGQIGRDAFGDIPVFEDKGIMRRAICAVGRQDVKVEDLKPVSDKIEVLGASSDHLLLNVTACPDLKVGQIVEFTLEYGGLLAASTSNYVTKYVI